MPKKTVREMSELERQHYSLGAKVFHATLMGTFVLVIVSLLIGMGAYSYALATRYIKESFGIARSTSLIVDSVVDIEKLTGDVMTTFHGLTPQQRSDPDSEEYQAYFEELTESEEYQYLLAVLAAFRDASEVFDLYIGVYDRETCSLVYIADPEEIELYECPIGYWEALDPDELDKFLGWDGMGELYDISKYEKYGWMCTSGVPIRNDNGDIICFVLADVTMGDMVSELGRFAWTYSISILLAMIVFAILLVQHMKKTMVKPINAIAEAAQAYIDEGKTGTPSSDHFADLNIRTGDEIENLSIVMADMERELRYNVENLVRVTAEKERIGTELSMASEIQSNMLPNIYPAFPDRPEFDIFASMDPAKEVGGDFYDFFLIDDEHLCFLMADVSGKGVPAALFMMASKIILANNAMMGKSPAQILTDTNAAICANNREDMFVSVWLGILELGTGHLTASNAGHEYPALYHRDGKFELVQDKHGPVIGFYEGAAYREYELMLEPGDKLFQYTDGVPEATDVNKDMFETDRMLDALNIDPSASPEIILKNVRSSVDEFVRKAEQYDDLTMLCLEFRGRETKGDGKA